MFSLAEIATYVTPILHVATELAVEQVVSVAMAQLTVVLAVCRTVMRQPSVVRMLPRLVKHVPSMSVAANTDL